MARYVLAHSPARRQVFARQARARFDAGEEKLRPVVKAALDRYLALVRDAVEKGGTLTAAGPPKKKPTHKVPAVEPDFTDEDASAVMDDVESQKDAFGAILDDTVMPALGRVVDDVVASGLARPDTNGSVMAWRNDWLAQRRQELVNIPDAVTEELRTAMRNAAEADGTNVDDARKLAQEMLDDGYPSWDGRAQLIARTETVGANNQGSLAQTLAVADADGLTGTKTWLATSDNRTRPDHADADGTTAPLDGTFSVGGVEMNGPGDPAGGASQVCNCRCTLTYEYDAPSSTDGDNGGDNGGSESDESGDGESLSAAADTAAPTGVAVMAALSAGDAARGAVAGGEQPGDLHVTLGYLDLPAASYSPEQKNALVSALTGTVAPLLPFEADAFATAHFNPEDDERDPCAVVLVQSDPLAAVHDAVGEAVADAGLALSDSFPIWIPHVTIAYQADPSVIPDGVVGSTLTFDRLDLGWAGEHTIIGGPVDQPGEDATTGQPTAQEYAVTVPAAPTAPPPAAAAPVATGGDTAAPMAPDEALEPSGITWSGPLALLDTPSSDGRQISSTGGSIRPLPQPLKWQREEAMMHDGAVAIGRILAAEVRGNVLWGSGDYLDPNLNFDVAQAMAQVDAGLGFVSVDLVVHALGWRDADTGQPVDPALLDPSDNTIEEALEWELGGATILTFASFADARISNDVPPDDAVEVNAVVEGVGMQSYAAATPPPTATINGDGTAIVLSDGTTAAVGDPIGYEGSDGQVTGTISAINADDQTVSITPPTAEDGSQPPDVTVPVGQLAPVPDDAPETTADAEMALLASSEVRPYTAAFFAKRDLGGPTPLTVNPETGEVFGHLATWGECHLGKLAEGKCVTAPPAPAGDYSYFHLSDVTTDTGLMSVGKVTLGAGHASRGGMRYAISHYDNSATAAAVVRAYDDAYGIQVAGQVIHDTPAATVEELMRSPLSGDWRKVDGEFRLVAALGVNSPGFAVRRPVIGMSGDEQISLVAAGVLERTTATILDEIVLASGRSIPRDDFEAIVAAAADALDRRTVRPDVEDELAIARARLSLRGSRHRHSRAG